MKPDKSTKRYVYVLIGCVLAVLAINASVVAVIDPMGNFCAYESASINKNRYFAISDRLTRSMRLKYGDFDTILFGTSRIQTGLPADNDWFSGGKTYNAGIPGTNMYELKELIDFALKYQDPKIIIFSLDFFAFSSRRSTSADFDSSLFASEWNLIPAVTRYLLSLDSLERAVNTVLANLKKGVPLDSNEMNNCDGTRVVFEISNQEDMFESGLGKMYGRAGVYNCYDYSQGRLDDFRSTLVAALESGASVALYITPIHAFQITGIEAAGLLPTFSQWRRDISTIVAELRQNSEVGDRLIAAWDFSPPVGVNTEAIPTAPDDQMVGYFDAGHHTHWVGTRVLDSLRENRLTDEGLPGYRLGEASSAGNFEQLAGQLEIYKVANPDVVAEVKQIRKKYSPKGSCPVIP